MDPDAACARGPVMSEGDGRSVGGQEGGGVTSRLGVDEDGSEVEQHVLNWVGSREAEERRKIPFGFGL